MKKILKFRWVIAGLVLLLFTVPVFATNCCNFLCDLFDCGVLATQTRIGIYPTLWRSRGDLFINQCDCIPNTETLPSSLGELPKFSSLYKLPWIVSTQLQYAWCGPWSIYGELNYIQASNKRTTVNTISALNSAIALRLSDYRAISLYAGILYFVDNMCWCDNARLFLGAKIGFIHHSTIDARQVTVSTTPSSACVCADSFKRNFLKKSTKLSGGVSAGLDYCLCDRLSLVFTGEVVVSGGPKGIACIPLLDSEILQLTNGSSLATGRIKTEISFPVTLGLKYTL